MGHERVAAFFDIDHTVLEINSGSKWIGYQWKTGQMSVWQVARALTWLARYRFGLLDFEAMARRVLRAYAGHPTEPIYAEVAQWFHRSIEWAICTEARAAIEEHRQEGHVIVLLTSATRFLSTPLATALSIEHILCTEVEEEDGVLTGRVVDPVCYGEGKVTHAERLAAEHGVDLDRSFFYTDSVSDLPMLERVGEPRVINPDPRLRRTAAERGWSVEIWRAPVSSETAKGTAEHVGS